MDRTTSRDRLVQYDGSTLVETQRNIPVEMPVTLTLNGQVWLDFLCTPEYLDALAVGFLFNENLIDGIEDIVQVHVCAQNDNVDVWTTRPLEKPALWRRTSGCSGGLSHPQPGDAPGLEVPAFPGRNSLRHAGFSLSPGQVNALVQQLFSLQGIHQLAGGVHASALSDGSSITLSCEDVGRHNTLDKLAGRVLLDKVKTEHRLVLTTGRISSEMIHKVARLGIPIVVSCTSPTDAAVRMAEAWNITLIGYARASRFTIYTHPQRVVAEGRLPNDQS